MRILFWGTPEFALPSLGALLGEGHDVVAVVTQPDRPRGRGRPLSPSPVKEFAESEGLPVFQPERARDPAFVAEVRALDPELNVAVAYGQILSRALLDAPARGSLNVHASLLPALRGAAPINWAIMRGHDRTGVTVMRMVEALDAGPMLMRVEEPILPEGTATDLAVRLSELGAAALVEVLALMEFGVGPDEVEQDESAATYAPRLSREDARVDWAEPAPAVANRVRGLDAVPGAWTLLNGGDELKVYRPLPAADRARGEPGTVLEASERDDEGILVACGGGAVWIREVKPAGKRRMTAAEWVRGRGVAAGDRLGA
ncbi:MAG TPA: methionyl-tRNA formyltransferase [Longimicrobiales bacterium]|nr:methionyl-tRNA formyltransferase [Longimicrobiales bacterium]